MRKLNAAIACRSQGTRLYGKPVQNLDVQRRIRVIDNLIDCLRTVPCIDGIVLGVAEGDENAVYRTLADQKGIGCVVGREDDVLGRLIACGEQTGATDIFRVTSECPFPYFEAIEYGWKEYVAEGADAWFLDEIVDGCGFEIASMAALRIAHERGTAHHKEHCTLYLRENKDSFHIIRALGPAHLNRKDLRLTVDNPEDLILARAVYAALGHKAPRIPVDEIVQFLDAHPELIALTAPFTEAGYSSMYVWGQHP